MATASPNGEGGTLLKTPSVGASIDGSISSASVATLVTSCPFRHTMVRMENNVDRPQATSVDGAVLVLSDSEYDTDSEEPSSTASMLSASQTTSRSSFTASVSHGGSATPPLPPPPPPLSSELTIVRVSAPAIEMHVAVPSQVPDGELAIRERNLNIYYFNKETGILVLHKPSNFLIDGSEMSVEAFLKSKYPDQNFHLVHQIDHATSGVFVVALSKKAAGGVCKLFRNRSVRKLYVAVVRGWVEQDTLAIDYPIDVDTESNDFRMRVAARESLCPFIPAGSKNKKTTAKSAQTMLHVVKRGYLVKGSSSCSKCSYATAETDGARHRLLDALNQAKKSKASGDYELANNASAEYVKLRSSIEATRMSTCKCCQLLDSSCNVSEKITETNEDVKVTLVHLELLTGRRHQLRVHLAAIGHPVVGDPLYEAVPPRGCEYKVPSEAHEKSLKAACPYLKTFNSGGVDQANTQDNDGQNSESEPATPTKTTSEATENEIANSLSIASSKSEKAEDTVTDSKQSIDKSSTKNAQEEEADSDEFGCLAWPYINDTVKRHRMLLHSQYMLLPLHSLPHMREWKNIDLAISIPSGFEQLVACSCEMREPDCGCSTVANSSQAQVTAWELAADYAPGLNLDDWHRSKIREARHNYKYDRARQHANYQSCLSSLSRVYESIINEIE